MKNAVLSLFIVLLISLSYSCDPLYSLKFQNKSNKSIIFRVQENDSTNMLSYKQFINNLDEIESDTINVKHYYSDSILYTEIVLLPDEYVVLDIGMGNYPQESINDKKYEVIINTDTIKINGRVILEDMEKHYYPNEYIYEFQTKK